MRMRYRRRLYISADPCLRQGRGGAWDHRRCGTCFCRLAFKPLQRSVAASTRHSIANCCYGIQACRLPDFKCPKCFAAASTRHSGHRHLLLERSSLPFASIAVQACRLPAFKCLKCFAAASTALWPEAFVVRAFKPAVCLHSHLLLGRSSLPFARLQMPKMLRGSFDQALWPQAFG